MHHTVFLNKESRSEHTFVRIAISACPSVWHLEEMQDGQSAPGSSCAVQFTAWVTWTFCSCCRIFHRQNANIFIQMSNVLTLNASWMTPRITISFLESCHPPAKLFAYTCTCPELKIIFTIVRTSNLLFPNLFVSVWLHVSHLFSHYCCYYPDKFMDQSDETLQKRCWYS